MSDADFWACTPCLILSLWNEHLGESGVGKKKEAVKRGYLGDIFRR